MGLTYSKDEDFSDARTPEVKIFSISRCWDLFIFFSECAQKNCSNDLKL